MLAGPGAEQRGWVGKGVEDAVSLGWDMVEVPVGQSVEWSCRQGASGNPGDVGLAHISTQRVTGAPG